LFCNNQERLHSFEPGETPSYSASHQAPNIVQTFLNITKHWKLFVTVPVWCRYFYNLLICSTVYTCI